MQDAPDFWISGPFWSKAIFNDGSSGASKTLRLASI